MEIAEGMGWISEAGTGGGGGAPHFLGPSLHVNQDWVFLYQDF